MFALGLSSGSEIHFEITKSPTHIEWQMSQRLFRMLVDQHRGNEAKQQINKERENECNFKEKKQINVRCRT